MDNLLSNAVEAMQQRGTVTVALDACTLDAEAALAQGLTVGDFFRITVTDEGPGMAGRSAAPRVRSVLSPPRVVPPREAATERGSGSSVVYTGWCAAGRATSRCTPRSGAGATFSVLIPRLGSS